MTGVLNLGGSFGHNRVFLLCYVNGISSTGSRGRTWGVPVHTFGLNSDLGVDPRISLARQAAAAAGTKRWRGWDGSDAGYVTQGPRPGGLGHAI